jgi:putative ABC transport system permease protein
MLKNMLKIAIRNILKERTYSLINIFGLTIGITSSVLILLYVSDELSYDKFHTNADNIYRVVSNITEPDNAFTWAVAQIPFAPELHSKYPEVENYTRASGQGRIKLIYEDKQFYEEDILMVDSTFFDVFTYRSIDGDLSTALDGPRNIVLTESLAIKYFGDEQAVGKQFSDDQDRNFTVTAVIEDVPTNSHLQFDALIGWDVTGRRATSWGNFGVFTYIQLPKDYNIEDLNPKLDSILVTHVNPIFESIGITVKYELQKITDIHLHSKIQDEAESNGDITYVYIFSAVALFMLIIAAINYMNLATARSSKRSREVGMRKVMGSQRGQLIRQFLTESIVLSVISLVFSILIIFLLLPFFNDLAGKSIDISVLFELNNIILLLLAVILIGFIAGSYPAFYLSGFKPVDVLKGKGSSSIGQSKLRKSLVVFQFGISVFMLISTMVVYAQLQFLREKDLGFNKDHIALVTFTTRAQREKFSVLKNELEQIPEIEMVSASSAVPGEGVGKVIMEVEQNDGSMIERGVDFFLADYDFIPTMGMSIVEGRNFSREILSDTIGATLANEAMVARMGWDEPLGKKLNIGDNNLTIVGVLKDYHQNSLYDEIEPVVIILSEDRRNVLIKAGGDVRDVMEKAELAWDNVYPNSGFEFSFLDQDFDSQYDADKRRGEIFTIFSGLTLIIACLGLLGLISFTTEQRTKEVGIRKVNGASVSAIIRLISKEFIILISIATIIAIPVSYYFMNNWLQSFAYKIILAQRLDLFILSAVSAFVITIITVAYHTSRAATANPVNALREE